MNPEDLDRIRFVTRHFGDLKGLQSTVPVGLIMLSIGLNGLGLDLLSWISMAVTCGAMGLMFLSRRYYRARFGEVESQSVGPSRAWRRVALAVGVFGAVFLALGPLRRDRVFYILYGTLLLFTWIWRGSRLAQGYYLVLGGLLLGLALPGAVLPPVRNPRGMTFTLCGAAMILAGLLDHWLLVRTLKRVEGSEPEACAEVGVKS
jgi:hypothetical protein